MNPTVAGDDDTPADEIEKTDDIEPFSEVLRGTGIAYVSNGGFNAKTGPKYAQESGNLVSYARWFTC